MTEGRSFQRSLHTLEKPVFSKFFNGIKQEFTKENEDYIDAFRKSSDTHPVARVLNSIEEMTQKEGKMGSSSNQTIPVKRRSSTTATIESNKNNGVLGRGKQEKTEKVQRRRSSEAAANRRDESSSSDEERMSGKKSIGQTKSEQSGFQQANNGQLTTRRSNQTNMPKIEYGNGNDHQMKPKQMEAAGDKAALKKKDASITKAFQYHSEHTMRFLYRSWRDEKMCDLLLVLGDFEFPIHKAVLAAHSKRYEWMFTHPDGAAMSEIVLQDCTHQGLSVVLNYIYTAQMQINANNLDDVIGCASQLHISKLTNRCYNILGSYNLSNVLLFLKIAEKHCLKELQEAMYNFVCERFYDLSMQEDFLQLPYKRIIQLMDEDGLNVEELQVFEAAVRWVTYDQQGRASKVVPLIKRVRFPLITAQDLAMRVEVVEEMLNPECRDMVLQAYRYHALKRLPSAAILLPKCPTVRQFTKLPTNRVVVPDTTVTKSPTSGTAPPVPHSQGSAFSQMPSMRSNSPMGSPAISSQYAPPPPVTSQEVTYVNSPLTRSPPTARRGSNEGMPAQQNYQSHIHYEQRRSPYNKGRPVPPPPVSRHSEDTIPISKAQQSWSKFATIKNASAWSGQPGMEMASGDPTMQTNMDDSGHVSDNDVNPWNISETCMASHPGRTQCLDHLRHMKSWELSE